MDRRDRVGVIAINVILFALLFGLVSLNKGILRPAFSHIPFLGILTGSFPNFAAACIISLTSAVAVLIREPKQGRLIVYVACLLVFAILTLEEFRPMWGASTHFDSFDILASGLGALVSIGIYELIVLRRKLKTAQAKLR